MQGSHSAWVIRIDEHTRATLQRWLRQQKTSLGLARRARSLLLLEQGLSSVSTARQVGLTERNLRTWVKRWSRQGPAGLSEQPRPGRLPVFSPEIALHVVKLACERPDRVGRSLSEVGIVLSIGAPIESRWACREHFSKNDPAHLTLPQAQTLAFSPVAFPKGASGSAGGLAGATAG